MTSIFIYNLNFVLSVFFFTFIKQDTKKKREIIKFFFLFALDKTH